MANPKNLLRTNKPTGCPYCCGNIITESNKINTLKRNIVNIEDFQLIEYKNSKLPITFKCKKCNYIFTRYLSSIRKNKMLKCPKCNLQNHNSYSINKIINILNNYNIKYKMEVYFNKFKSLGNSNVFKYDIYIPSKKLLIEFDGKQHFKKSIYGGKDILFRDFLKNEKIKRNKNLSLLRISYLENNFIEEILESILNKKVQRLSKSINFFI